VRGNNRRRLARAAAILIASSRARDCLVEDLDLDRESPADRRQRRADLAPARFYVEGTGNKIGDRVRRRRLAPDLLTVRFARYSVSFMPALLTGSSRPWSETSTSRPQSCRFSACRRPDPPDPADPHDPPRLAGTYGSPCIHAELAAQGIHVGRKRATFGRLGPAMRFSPGNHDIGDSPLEAGGPPGHPLDLERLADYRPLFRPDRWSIRAGAGRSSA
jgi:hypothetical protein